MFSSKNNDRTVLLLSLNWKAVVERLKTWGTICQDLQFEVIIKISCPVCSLSLPVELPLTV